MVVNMRVRVLAQITAVVKKDTLDSTVKSVNVFFIMLNVYWRYEESNISLFQPIAQAL